MISDLWLKKEFKIYLFNRDSCSSDYNSKIFVLNSKLKEQVDNVDEINGCVLNIKFKNTMDGISNYQDGKINKSKYINLINIFFK